MSPTQVERDPSGTDPHAPGAKMDAGKLRVGLVLGSFVNALEEVSSVGTIGAAKYSDDGWLAVPDGVNRYTDAMLRHLLKEWQGERVDADTEQLHAAQVAWNALARLELMMRSADE